MHRIAIGNMLMKRNLPLNFLLLFCLMDMATSSPLEMCGNWDCGCENTPHEIFNGIVTGAHQYPWMVRLEGCGGSLISDRHVLTAKHCVEGKDQEWVKVGVHDQDDENVYQEIKIKEYVTPDYYLDHDIAIIILAEPVTFTRKIRHICLPTPDEQINVGNKMRHLGWGMTGVDLEQSPVLKQADLTVSIVSPHKNVFYTEVNTNEGDPCAGDSGGPLMSWDSTTRKWTIFGILRGGGYDCLKNDTNGDGKWNKVTSRLDWINEIIDDDGIPSPDPECSEESGVIGPCEGYFERFTYNKKSGKCERFIYGGCEGNSNRFKTLEECQLKCNKPGEPSACYTTTSKKCIFPFVYKGKTFNSCTNFGKSPNPWCATRVRSNTNNEVVSGEWGDCDPQSCPSVGAQQGVLPLPSLPARLSEDVKNVVSHTTAPTTTTLSPVCKRFKNSPLCTKIDRRIPVTSSNRQL